MGVTAKPTDLSGVLELTVDCFRDQRGFFMESYNRREYWNAGLQVEFVQDNHSRSVLHTLRGLHYQDSSAPGAKLVRCTRGGILDVAVDLRLGGPTFGKWVAIELSEDNLKQLFIPVGFAHGYLALSPDTEVQYKSSAYYTPSAECTIKWDDPEIAIRWPVATPIVSAKDQAGMPLAEYRLKPSFGVEEH